MEITASLQQTFKKTEVKKNPTYGSEIAQLCKKIIVKEIKLPWNSDL